MASTRDLTPLPDNFLGSGVPPLTHFSWMEMLGQLRNCLTRSQTLVSEGRALEQTHRPEVDGGGQGGTSGGRGGVGEAQGRRGGGHGGAVRTVRRDLLLWQADTTSLENDSRVYIGQLQSRIDAVQETGIELLALKGQGSDIRAATSKHELARAVLVACRSMMNEVSTLLFCNFGVLALTTYCHFGRPRTRCNALAHLRCAKPKWLN